jgi:phage/plasmid primase-like uncharacterized protein
MTSTIDNLKRKGGDQLSDWTAPRTTEASKPIITYRFSSFDVIAGQHNELSALAASVGIDWQAVYHRIAFNGRPLKGRIELEPRYKDKVFVVASEKDFKHKGEVVGSYPIITFKTFKHGGESVVFNGLNTARAHFESILGRTSTIASKVAKVDTSAIIARVQAKKQRQEKEDAKNQAYKDKRLADFDALFKTLPHEVGDHAYLVKKFGHLAPQAALLLDMRRGNDSLGDYIAYALHGQNGRVIGYQRIYAEIPKGREDNKDFIGSTKGAFAIVGDPSTISGRAYIAEGLSNAITFTLAENKACFVALNAGNLANVVPFVRREYANNITMLADNDRKNLAQNGNIGVFKALKAIDYKGGKDDYLIIPPCNEAINWDFNDVLTSHAFDLEAVRLVIQNKDNRRKKNIDLMQHKIECIELMPSNQREKNMQSLLAYAVSVAPMRSLDKSLERISKQLGDDWQEFIGSRLDWVYKIYDERKDSVKQLFSFTDKLPLFLAMQSTIKQNAYYLLHNALNAPMGSHCIYADNRQMGEGKTLFMAEIAKLAKLIKGVRVGYIAHRVTLIENSAARLGLENYQNLKPHDMPDVQHMAICANSLASWYFSDFFTDCDVLFIDEIKQVLEHIAIGSFDNRERAKVLEIIKTAIKNAKLVICADADLDQKTLDFLKSCNKPIRQIASSVNATPKADKTIIYSDLSTIRDKAISSVLEGKNTLIQCSTKAETESLRLIFLGHGVSDADILVVNSDTKAEQKEALFLKDPDAYLTEYQSRVVLASPTISSGFSIERPYFQGVYLLQTGILTPTNILQTSARYRLAKVIYIGFEDNKNRPEPTTEQQKILGDAIIKKRLHLAIDPNTDLLSVNIEGTSFDSLRYKVATQHDESLKDYNNKTLLCFEAKGYTVQPLAVEELSEIDYTQTSKEARKAVKAQRIGEIMHADIIDAKTADQYERKANTTTRKEKRELERYKITQQLATSEPSFDDVEFWEDNGLKKIHLFEILQSDKEACIAFDSQQELIQKNLTLQTKAFAKNGLLNAVFESLGLDPKTGKGSFGHDKAVNTLTQLSKYDNEMAALGLGNFEKINEQFAVRTINNLLKKLGLQTAKGGKNSARRYFITSGSWQSMSIYAENRKRQRINVLDLNKAAQVFSFIPDDEILKDFVKVA